MAGRGRGGSGGRGRRGGGAGAKTCNICHKVGHIAADCRSAGKKYCTNCKMTNHNTADCTRGAKKGDKKITFDTSTALSRTRVTRPCRFCKEMHLDKDCPTKGVSGASTTVATHGDTVLRDIFGTPVFSPPCQYCGGQHLSTDCSTIIHQPVDQYQYQRFPAQVVQFAPPPMSLWDACDDIHEEFVSGDPWTEAMRYGLVDGNLFPTYYTQDVAASVHHQQKLRTDRDGDVFMEW